MLIRFLLWFLCAFASVVHAEEEVIVLHASFGAPHFIYVEGRVIEAKKRRAISAKDGAWRNLKRGARQFFNDEAEHLPLRMTIGNASFETLTDEEGYFSLEAKTPEILHSGWQMLPIQSIPSEADEKVITNIGAILIVPPENTRGIISDVDDTIVVSEVLDKSRLLANTFLKNAAQREAVQGVAPFFQQMLQQNPAPQSAAMIYLSASPRQLYESIDLFLNKNQFPKGILITKRIGLDDKSDPLTDQMAYKIGKIETVLARLPWVTFTLVGDDGEKDPEIYAEIKQRHPARIDDIFIRRVNPKAMRPRFEGQKELLF